MDSIIKAIDDLGELFESFCGSIIGIFFNDTEDFNE